MKGRGAVLLVTVMLMGLTHAAWLENFSRMCSYIFLKLYLPSCNIEEKIYVHVVLSLYLFFIHFYSIYIYFFLQSFSRINCSVWKLETHSAILGPSEVKWRRLGIYIRNNEKINYTQEWNRIWLKIKNKLWYSILFRNVDLSAMFLFCFLLCAYTCRVCVIF